MLNSQKLFLSAIRLVTGFVGAGCYQFQIEPEVLIKPSSLVSFSFLPETSKLEPSVYKQIFSLSFMLPSRGQWLPGMGRPCQRAASSRVAAVGCAGRGEPVRSALADAHQIYPHSWGLPSTTGLMVSRCTPAWQAVLSLVPLAWLPGRAVNKQLHWEQLQGCWDVCHIPRRPYLLPKPGDGGLDEL